MAKKNRTKRPGWARDLREQAIQAYGEILDRVDPAALEWIQSDDRERRDREPNPATPLWSSGDERELARLLESDARGARARERLDELGDDEAVKRAYAAGAFDLLQALLARPDGPRPRTGRERHLRVTGGDAAFSLGLRVIAGRLQERDPDRWTSERLAMETGLSARTVRRCMAGESVQAPASLGDCDLPLTEDDRMILEQHAELVELLSRHHRDLARQLGDEVPTPTANLARSLLDRDR